jgi:DNA-binding Xre family transcriptional regulator
MSKRVERGVFNRWCRTCGWKGTYDTAAKGDYAKRAHSCEKYLAKAEGAERLATRKAAIDRTPKPCLHKIADHQHGTRTAYVLDRCRCLRCAKANALSENERYRQKAYGRYDKYVDAEPVRAHVRELSAQGMGHKRIARAAGISNATLTKLVFGTYASMNGPSRGRYGKGDLVRGPSKRLLRTTADKLMAVELDLADGVQVDATGTTRRVRALVALGWSQSKLANRLGIRRSNFHLARGDRAAVLAVTAKAVDELYDELSMVIPPQETHRDKISVSRALKYSKARGWLPPLALDDEYLDDPTYKPGSLVADDFEDEGSILDQSAIYRRMHGDRNVRLTKDEKAELRRRWISSGRSLAELERVTGLNSNRKYETAHQEAS